MNKEFCLYTLFDDNYFECGSNLIFSFLSNNSWFNGDIVVICDDGLYCNLSKTNRKKLKKIYNNISFLEVNHNNYMQIFDYLLNNNICEKKFLSCFYKYEIFKKTGYKKKVYLDSDIIINGDIKELFNNPASFATCLDVKFEAPIIDENRILHLRKRNDIDYYFNGGVYVVDDSFNEKYSFERIYNETLSIGTEKLSDKRISGHGKYADQDFLNIIFHNEDVSLFPSILYNCNPIIGNANVELFNKSKIQHFYGWYKPWNEDSLNCFSKDFYKQYYFYTYWKNYKLKT